MRPDSANHPPAAVNYADVPSQVTKLPPREIKVIQQDPRVRVAEKFVITSNLLINMKNMCKV